MRNLIQLSIVMVLCLAALPVLAAKTLELTANRTDDISVPNQGLTFVVPADQVVELSGVLSGAGPLIKRGKGTLILSGANRLTGDTLVEEGVLELTHAGAINTAQGTIAVKGNGNAGSAVLKSHTDLGLGHGGDSRLIISNGGLLCTADGVNIMVGMGHYTQIDVNGPGAELSSGGDLYIGQTGRTELNVGTGAQVRAAGDVMLAGVGARVTAYVAGGDAVLGGRAVYLGHQGKLELDIRNRGSVRADADGALFCAWGDMSEALINVSGAGSSLLSSGSMYLGYGGKARITVESGGIVQTLLTDAAQNGLYLAYLAGSRADVRVGGYSAMLISGGDLVVGHGGDANLNVRDKGRVTFKGGLCMGFAASGNGVTRITGAGAVLSDYTRLYNAAGEFTGFIDSPDVDEHGEYEEYYEGDYEEEEPYPEPEEDADAPDFIPELGIVAGFRGYGELHVNQGAKVEVSGDIYAGYRAEAKGVIQASGSRSIIMTGQNMYIGNWGYGELLFEGGAEGIGEYNAAMIYIACDEGSTGKVDVKGTGSSLSASEEIMGGYKGHAVINLSDGGRLGSPERGISLGVYEGAKAEISVSGTDSALQSGRALASSYGGKLEVGGYGEAVMNISDGGKVSASGDVYLGHYGRGVVNLAGAESSLAVGGSLDIGPSGYGELNVGSGVVFQYNPEHDYRRETDLYLGRYNLGRGVINMAANSRFTSYEYMYVGGDGAGEINLAANSVLEIYSASFYLGTGDSGTGRLTADNAQITLGDMTVGDEGDAEVKLVHGTKLKVYRLWVASAAGSNATFLLDASQITCDRYMDVGHLGKGRMDVMNGSLITMPDTLAIGSTFGEASGVMTVDNSEVRVEDTSLSVGSAGTGVLNIQNGGKVYIKEDIHITWHEDYTSTINVTGSGSYLEGGKHLYVGYQGDGILNISDGAQVKVLRDVHVGMQAKGSGVLNIDGENSGLTAGAVIEGRQGGQADINLTNGGQIKIIERDREADEFQDTVDWMNSFEFSM